MTFIKNPLFDKEFAREPRTIEAMLVRAGEVAALAKAIAPVDTGAYRDSIGVAVDDTGTANVVAKDFKAWWIEYGTVRTPVHSTIRRAVKEAGLILHESKT